MSRGNNEPEFEAFYHQMLDNESEHYCRNFSFVNSCKEALCPIIIYGAGKNGKAVFHICKITGIKVAAFCDKYKTGFYGDTTIPILAPSELAGRFEDAMVIISAVNFDAQIRRELADAGISGNRLLSVPTVCNYLEVKPEFEQKFLEGYRWAYYFFEDKVSRQIILNRLRFHLFGDLLERTTEQPEYFELPLSEKEVFVQAGCYDGSTVKDALKIFGVGWKIYSFEADPQSYEISKRNLTAYGNVKLIPKGLWSSETILQFAVDQNGGGSSFVIGSEKTVFLEVTSLDRFFEGEVVTPTFIQLDIEGSELEALKGAENIIRTCKPKLAVCVYHRTQDLYEIPQLLYEYNPEYHFLLQQCTDGLWDTVLYAV